MTEQAKEWLRELAHQYVLAGYEARETFCFEINPSEMTHFGNELFAMQIIEPVEGTRRKAWRLSEGGFLQIINAIPLSHQALELWKQLKALHVQEKYPDRTVFEFSSDTGEEIAIRELLVRGRIERAGRKEGRESLRLTPSGFTDLLRVKL